MNPFETPKFKKLQSKWDAKLRSEGLGHFDNSRSEAGRAVANGINNDRDFETRQIIHRAKHEYYKLAGYFLYDHKFESYLDMAIWAAHAEGISARHNTRKFMTKVKEFLGITKYTLKIPTRHFRDTVYALEQEMKLHYKVKNESKRPDSD